MIFRRRDYRRPPWFMNFLTDGIIRVALLCALLGVAAFLADCDDRYHFFR